MIENSFTVLTQNVWGGVPAWERRRAVLAREIARHRPDIIGLQEVHSRPPGDLPSGDAAPPFSGGRAASSGPHPTQAHELAAILGGYHAYFAPGRCAPSGAAEGVALLCKGTVREHAVHTLTLDESDRFDRNQQRVVLCATIEAGDDCFDVFVTHLSLSPRARRRTVRELLAIAEQERRRSGSRAAVLLGDFNAPSRDRIHADLGRESAGIRWLDVWKATHGAWAPGGTWPAFLPFFRLDYIFVQPPQDWNVERCERLPFAGSDHLGLLARLSHGAPRSPRGR